MLITNVVFRFGSSADQPPLNLEPGPMTVFVGPNSSGKSLALKEINALLQNQSRPSSVILSVDMGIPSRSMLSALLPERTTDLAHQVQLSNMSGGGTSFIPQNLFRACDEDLPADQRRAALFPIFFAYTLFLDGQSRLQLCNPCNIGTLDCAPMNILDKLFRDDDAQRRWASLVHEAFGFYPVVDHTHPPVLTVRTAARLPDREEQKALVLRAASFFRDTQPLTDASDGVRAYVGMTAAFLARRFVVALIDEPEAFLYPPLIRRLGSDLTSLSADRQAHVFAATHSADFLLGCISTGRPVNVIRLTYRNNVASTRLLCANRLQVMMRDPLLRSTNVISALFHEGAVVCESDRDRAFYQEINERLLLYSEGGARSTLFLNAHSKQDIRRIIRPLRELGVPAAAIVDLDALKDADFKELLHSAFVPQGLIDSLGQLKGQVNARLKAGLPNGGYSLDSLAAHGREEAEALLSMLAEYGVFLVPVGAVEGWLREIVGACGKSEWLLKAFAALGSDPEAPTYIRSSDDDVWWFLRAVAKWIADPRRKGLPD